MSLGNDQEGQPDNEDQVLENAEMLFPFALHIFPGDDAGAEKKGRDQGKDAFVGMGEHVHPLVQNVEQVEPVRRLLATLAAKNAPEMMPAVFTPLFRDYPER
jgi:hypothetical protein